MTHRPQPSEPSRHRLDMILQDFAAEVIASERSSRRNRVARRIHAKGAALNQILIEVGCPDV